MTMDDKILNGVIVSVIAIVSGSVLYYPYKIIGDISKEIGNFGGRDDIKLKVMNKILKAQGGGVVLFFGCYIIAVGLVSALLLKDWQNYFVYFLLAGVLSAIIGLIIINHSFCTRGDKKCDAINEESMLPKQETPKEKSKEATMKVINEVTHIKKEVTEENR